MSRMHTARPRASGNGRVRSGNPEVSQRITLEASTLKIDWDATPLSSSSDKSTTTSSKVGFSDARVSLVQKQAWDSSPDKLDLGPTSAVEQRGTGKVRPQLHIINIVSQYLIP